jgi:hypothetical protein
MADSSFQRASKAVATACAATTTFVKIISIQPFDVSPDNLFLLTFSAIGIASDAQMEAFRHTLIALLPESLMGDLQKMDLAPGIVIRLVVNHVEALLLAPHA